MKNQQAIISREKNRKLISSVLDQLEVVVYLPIGFADGADPFDKGNIDFTPDPLAVCFCLLNEGTDELPEDEYPLFVKSSFSELIHKTLSHFEPNDPNGSKVKAKIIEELKRLISAIESGEGIRLPEGDLKQFGA